MTAGFEDGRGFSVADGDHADDATPNARGVPTVPGCVRGRSFGAQAEQLWPSPQSSLLALQWTTEFFDSTHGFAQEFDCSCVTESAHLRPAAVRRREEHRLLATTAAISTLHRDCSITTLPCHHLRRLRCLRRIRRLHHVRHILCYRGCLPRRFAAILAASAGAAHTRSKATALAQCDCLRLPRSGLLYRLQGDVRPPACVRRRFPRRTQGEQACVPSRHLHIPCTHTGAPADRPVLTAMHRLR